MKIIFGGHWDNPPKGWTSIPESEQDLTSFLKHETESVDTIFTEHVAEHLSFLDCIWFMEESYRCLKKGGIFMMAFRRTNGRG